MKNFMTKLHTENYLLGEIFIKTCTSAEINFHKLVLKIVYFCNHTPTIKLAASFYFFPEIYLKSIICFMSSNVVFC